MFLIWQRNIVFFFFCLQALSNKYTHLNGTPTTKSARTKTINTNTLRERTENNTAARTQASESARLQADPETTTSPRMGYAQAAKKQTTKINAQRTKRHSTSIQARERPQRRKNAWNLIKDAYLRPTESIVCHSSFPARACVLRPSCRERWKVFTSFLSTISWGRLL